MTIEQAKKHPMYKTAYGLAKRCGYRGGMDNMEFGLIVMAYIKGYNRAKNEKEKDTIERACDMLMDYFFKEVTPEMRDHFRKRLEEYNG